MKKYAIGTDIGGSHISAVLMDLEKAEIVTGSHVSSDVDNHAPATEILQTWSNALNRIIKDISREELAGIGFAMPGPFDYQNGIAMFTKEVAKYEHLYKVDVSGAIRELLNLPAEVPFRYMNDASSFAVGEAWIGKAVPYRRSIAITLGTGFGSAFIDSGIPVIEGNHVPKYGNFWHLPYNDGIADDYFSTRWFTGRYKALKGISVNGVKEIAADAMKDPQTGSIFNEFGNNLGNFLAPWIQKFDAGCIVIGGNMIKAWDLFGGAFHTTLKSRETNVAVHLSELCETSAMVGSARLLDETYWQKVRSLI